MVDTKVIAECRIWKDLSFCSFDTEWDIISELHSFVSPPVKWK